MSYETDHPASADLLAVVLGTLDGEDRDPIEEHLSRCPECAQTVLDFNSFPDLEPVDEESPEMRARLEDQKRRLIEMGRREEAGPLEAPGDVIRGPWLARAEVAWGVAAVFFVATVGLVAWGGGPRGLGKTYFVSGMVTASRGPEAPTRIPLVGDYTVVQLTLQSYALKYSEYRVLFTPEAGGKALSGSRLRLAPSEDSLLVTILSSRVSPGVYRFDVLGVDAGKEPNPIGHLWVEFVAGSETETEDE